MTPLVSIIIPTYNRAHLISETLDSVLVQTYQNWECIVIDDGSTDSTSVLMETYIKKDNRFKYHHRPNSRLPGGNAARNYGFELSKGEYINWFDSDDLMVVDKLALKVEALLKPNIDFVISKTKYFNKIETNIYPYNYTANQVTFESYTTSYISWFTPDLMLKREFANLIRFNEDIKAGQEYNFCSKLTLLTNKIGIVNQYLTLRRAHDESIGAKRQKDKTHYLQTKFHLHWVTYSELEDKTDSVKFKKYSLLLCVLCYFQNKQKKKLPKKFHRHIIKVFGYKYIYFILGILTESLIGKHYFFYSRLKK